LEDLKRACNFIEGYRAQGAKVYVHCKAGHGRGGAVALAWMAFSRGPGVDEAGLRALNEELLAKRRVRKALHEQPNIRALAAWVRGTGAACGCESAEV